MVAMGYSVDVYNTEGKIVSKVDLNSELFADEKVNKTLIQEYLLLQQANGRVAIADTKDRSEVSGSGKKLYRQKGTGNGRVWDKNSPLRRHGWIAFGPTSARNFEKFMTKKARKKAMNGIITMKAQESALCGLALEKMEPKTKEAVSIVEKLGLSNQKVLLVLDSKNEWIEKSFRNIAKVKYILVDYLNPRDVLHADKVVFLEKALAKINQA